MAYYVPSIAGPTEPLWQLKANDVIRSVYLIGSTVTINQDGSSTNWPYKSRDNFENQSLSRKYNSKFGHSFVISVDPLSYHKDVEKFTIIIYNMFEIMLSKLRRQYQDIVWLGVVEQSNVRGIHMHLTGFYYKSFPKTLIESIMSQITSIKFNVKPILVTRDTPGDINCTFITTEQKIKSIASYINYLKKDVKAVYGTNDEVLTMFINFERTHIFEETSFPKRQKRSATTTPINSTNELVIFLNTQMQLGRVSLQDILTLQASQAYLHIPNLSAIYQNVYMQFVASCYHENNIMSIIKKFLENKTNLGCACPLLEILSNNKLDIASFMNDIFEWLTGNSKKNAFTLIGPPNSGKSTLAKLIWELFPIHTRIIPDGLFSFANLINSGCGLWEEPYIDQTIIDTAKLVLEGEPSVQIAIKNKPSQALGKRVPILITTNRSLSYFVSSESDALDVRMFMYTLPIPFNISNICTASNHYCNNLIIGTSGSTTSTFSPNKGISTEQTDEISTCTHSHKLLSEHVLTFLVYVLKLNSHKVHKAFGKNQEEIVELLNLVSFSDFDIFLNDHQSYPNNIPY